MEHEVGEEKLEAPFEKGQGAEGAVAKYMKDGRTPIFVDIGQTDLHITHTYTARFVCDIMIYRTTDILVYFTTDVLIYYTTERINSYNQLNVHKIRSSDVRKSPTSSGSPLSNHHSALKMVHCIVIKASTQHVPGREDDKILSSTKLGTSAIPAQPHTPSRLEQMQLCNCCNAVLQPVQCVIYNTPSPHNRIHVK